MCVCRNFLSVGVSVRESYWRIGVRGLEGVCHQVGGANFTGMTQTKKAELRNALKVRVFPSLPPSQLPSLPSSLQMCVFDFSPLLLFTDRSMFL